MAKWARIENGVVAELVTTNPSGQFHNSILWVACSDSVVVGDVYSGGAFSSATPQELTNEEKRTAIAAQRFALETGGVIEPVSGKTILTDRESQQILDSTIEKIRRGLIPSVQWKCADGWIELNEDNIDAVEILVLTHVQTAFAWEKTEQERLGLNV